MPERFNEVKEGICMLLGGEVIFKIIKKLMIYSGRQVFIHG